VSDSRPAATNEELRLRLRCAELLNKALNDLAAAMDRIDWSRASPLEFVQAIERLIVLHRLVLGVPMTVEQVIFHLSPDEPAEPGDTQDS
jgi:hypothetical protein